MSQKEYSVYELILIMLAILDDLLCIVFRNCNVYRGKPWYSKQILFDFVRASFTYL